MDSMSDKYSIKNLLFTKAIPNYVIPVPQNGHKVYTCTDCGDKFVFESSYNYHINRKSVKISYMCRHCGKLIVFHNRCNLLCHIRSHAFKTATINVSDLIVEPLPISYFKKSTSSKIIKPDSSKKIHAAHCTECKTNIAVTGVAYKDRSGHYMQLTNEIHSCPVCLFALPNTCALKTHLRVHLKIPPYYCVECGSQLPKNINYPYNHDCEGFKMMRATARLKCAIQGCNFIHPNNYKDHMKEKHLKKVFKCPFCVVACFNETTMRKHLKGSHKLGSNETVKPLIFYQCEACPGKFVMHNHMDQHLKTHVNSVIVFPCWACGVTFDDVPLLLKHFIEEHSVTEVMKTVITTVLNKSEKQQYLAKSKPKRIYRVVKRCDQCLRSFTYKCDYDEIGILPNECPYQCTSPLDGEVNTGITGNNKDNNLYITCYLCKIKIPQNWEIIKKHYAESHKSMRCLDVRINITRLDIKKYQTKNKKRKTKSKSVAKMALIPVRRQQKKFTASSVVAKDTPVEQQANQSVRQNNFSLTGLAHVTTAENGHICKICNNSFENKDLLEGHMISHRDPCMAYQCMECGQSFVVKPTFSKHLLVVHGISNTEEYIESKQCYNETALLKYQDSGIHTNEPVGENQCKICREQFNDADELEKHFRVHGMAFLMKNTSNKNNS